MLQIRTILVARDFSAASERALRYAGDLARRTGARLHLLFCQTDGGQHGSPPSAPDPFDGRIYARLRQASEAVPVDPARVTAAVEHDGTVAAAITGYAAAHDIDLIVMGAYGGEGRAHPVRGSVTEEVVRTAPCPVLAVRAPEAGPPGEPVPTAFARILAGLDLSAQAGRTLATARALAAIYDAALILLFAVDDHAAPLLCQASRSDATTTATDLEVTARAGDALRALYACTPGSETSARFEIRFGRPACEIVAAAERHAADLLVMTVPDADRHHHGEVAEQVLRLAPCPVLTIRSSGKGFVNPAEHHRAAAAYEQNNL